MVEVREWAIRGRGHSYWLRECQGTPAEELPLEALEGGQVWKEGSLCLSVSLCCHFMHMKQEKQRQWETPMENKTYFYLAGPEGQVWERNGNSNGQSS